MRVMVFMKATPDSENGMEPTPEMIEAFAAMDRFTEDLVAAGVFVAAAGLKPSAQGKRIAFDGASRTVIDGPFADARELVAGFSIWQVKDMDEAVAWAKRCPNPMAGPSEIEIRPLFEVENLAGFVTPEKLASPRGGERGRLGVAWTLGRCFSGWSPQAPVATKPRPVYNERANEEEHSPCWS